MRVRQTAMAVAILSCPVLAAAAPGDGNSTAAEIQNQANFCEGTYALCIKAPCVGIPRLDRLGNYVTDEAACSCEVVRGWSMGPGACVDRAPVRQNGRTYLISTYSNRSDQAAPKGNTLTCQNAKTVWAWCYGAPCVVDENDPGKATCTCPLQQSAMSTLGGDCRQESCGGIWSGATPAGATFAGQYFAQYMRQNHPDVPTNPPPAACRP